MCRAVGRRSRTAQINLSKEMWAPIDEIKRGRRAGGAELRLAKRGGWLSGAPSQGSVLQFDQQWLDTLGDHKILGPIELTVILVRADLYAMPGLIAMGQDLGDFRH